MLRVPLPIHPTRLAPALIGLRSARLDGHRHNHGTSAQTEQPGRRSARTDATQAATPKASGRHQQKPAPASLAPRAQAHKRAAAAPGATRGAGGLDECLRRADASLRAPDARQRKAPAGRSGPNVRSPPNHERSLAPIGVIAFVFVSPSPRDRIGERLSCESASLWSFSGKVVAPLRAVNRLRVCEGGLGGLFCGFGFVEGDGVAECFELAL